MSATPDERIEEVKDAVHETLVETGMTSWQASRIASAIELIARLVLADMKSRGDL